MSYYRYDFNADFNTLFQTLEANGIRLEDFRITAKWGNKDKPLVITIPAHAVQAFTVTIEDTELAANRNAAIGIRSLVFNAVQAAIEAQKVRAAEAQAQAAAAAQVSQPNDEGSGNGAAGQ